MQSSIINTAQVADMKVTEILELPGVLAKSELHFWHAGEASTGFPEPPRTIAWSTGRFFALEDIA